MSESTPITIHVRCLSVTRARQPVFDEDGRETDETRVGSITAVLSAPPLPLKVHTNKTHTAIVTVTDPAEFGMFKPGAVYEVRVAPIAVDD